MMEDSDPCLGIYDMRIDTTGMPEFLANKININICNKGGGGGNQTQTTTSGIAPEFKPYIKKVLADVTSKYESDVAGGPDAIVAQMTPEQIAALDAQSKAANEAITGTGEYDTAAARRRDIENLMGSSVGQSAAAGGLGSARSERAMMGAVADRSLALQKDRQSALERGISSLGEVGTTKQQYEQQRLDAPDTAAQRYFGYLAGAPQQSTTTKSGGGGK